jgi:hypothetical protein
VQAVLDHPDVRAVRRALLAKLAVAEGEMERCWGEMFCARASLAVADLADFVYWDCYRHLVGSELRSLPPDLALSRGRSVAFVGAGPLPLSAILLNVRSGLKVTCIDRNLEACRMAGALCRKLHLSGVDVVCAGGARYDYGQSPVVFIASLVPDKRKVMRRIRETGPQALVALRSTEGLSTLPYDPVDEAELKAMGCRPFGRTSPGPYAINTTLLYEAAPALRGAACRRRAAALPVLFYGAPRWFPAVGRISEA